MPLNINKIARMDRRAEPRLRDDLACFFMEFSCEVELARWRLGPRSMKLKSARATAAVPVSSITFLSLSNSRAVSGRPSDRFCAQYFWQSRANRFPLGLSDS